MWTNKSLVNKRKCAFSIQPSAAGRRNLMNSLDDSILHVDVRTERLVIVHNLPSFDEETVAL